MDLVRRLRQTVALSEHRVVLPEGDDPRVLQAATVLRDERLAQPILLGNAETMQTNAAAAGIQLDGLTLIDPRDSKDFDRYVNAYASRRELSANIAARMLRRSLFFGGMMVAEGDADTMVAGVSNATAVVIQAGALTVGYAEGIETPSSFFLMILPARHELATDELIFADCAVNIAPTPAQLADIAVASGNSAARLLADEPRVAMLSFSTDGSAAHEVVDEVTEALELARAKAPTLAIDGEFQADTALVAAIAQRKLKRPSSVAGKANVLVFPDLTKSRDLGVIAMKVARTVHPGRGRGGADPKHIEKLQAIVDGPWSVPQKAYLWGLSNDNLSAVISNITDDVQLEENLKLPGVRDQIG